VQSWLDDPKASSSRTERAGGQNRCSSTLPQVRTSWAGTITAPDRG
jgi:hypothetical protein